MKNVRTHLGHTFILVLFFSTIIMLVSCQESPNSDTRKNTATSPVPEKNNSLKDFFSENPTFIADGFDFPIGKPNAKGYYNAQPFKQNNHLGDDWNAVTGGNSDLGDPIYSIAHGIVVHAKDEGGGWGNVIKIVHYNPQLKPKYYESVYAHCDTIMVKENQPIKKGAQIGTIGNANGAYYAHLHFEIRDSINMPLGGGYSPNTSGFLDPTKFIKSNRKIQE